MLSIIIVTWNKKKYVLNLLSQLSRINYPSHKLRVIVVDNNSEDDTVDAISSSFPEVTLIKNSKNLGGSGGFNTGMRWVLDNNSDCEFMWLLDNDVEVEADTLTRLVEALKSETGAAVCGSKVMDIQNRKDIVEVGAFIDYKRGRIRRFVPDKQENINENQVFEVDYVAACSLLVRVDLVKRFGLWYDKLFIYWDDMEWCARFKSSGYGIIASNASVVYHPIWNDSATDNSTIWRSYYRSRNSLWFFNNYTGGIKRRSIIFSLILRIMIKSGVSCIKANKSLSKAYLNGVEDFFKDCYGKRPHRLPTIDLGLQSDKKIDFICLVNIILMTFLFLIRGLIGLPAKERSVPLFNMP